MVTERSGHRSCHLIALVARMALAAGLCVPSSLAAQPAVSAAGTLQPTFREFLFSDGSLLPAEDLQVTPRALDPIAFHRDLDLPSRTTWGEAQDQVVLLPTHPPKPTESLPFVIVPDNVADPAAAVAGLSTGGTVFVRAQESCYSLNNMIHIDRSHVSLIGEEGVCLRLADHVNRPVILIGSSSETVPPAERIFDVTVRGFLIDGNRQKQDQENAVGLPNVQNNAIGVRGAERVHLQRLTLSNARSGGLVISQQARKVFVEEVVLSENAFDGLAIDGASEVFVEHFVSEDNDFSGVSVDTGTSRVQIRDGLIQKNGDNGLFIRFASESSFSDLTIVDNCNFGVFASHANPSGGEGLVEIDFSDLRIFRNGNAGFSFATSQAEGSFDNFLTNSRIAGNNGTGSDDEIVGTNGNAAITVDGNTVTGFRTDGPTNRTCSP